MESDIVQLNSTFRRLTRMAVVTALLCFTLGVLYVFAVFSTRASQLEILVAYCLGAAGVSSLMAFKLRQKRWRSSSRALQIVWWVGVLLHAVLVANLGVFWAGLGVIATLAGRPQVGTRHSVRAALVFSALTCVTLLLDWIIPTGYRIVPDETLSWIPTSALVLLICVSVLYIIARFRTYRIWAKLIIAFLLIALLPAALMAIVNAMTIEPALVADSERALSAASEQTASQIDVFINTNLDNIRTESQLPDLSNYLSLSPYELEDGSQRAEVVDILRAFTRRSPAYTRSYALLDVDGLDIVDTDIAHEGKYEFDQDYFRTPFREHLPYASPFHVDGTTGNASIYFSNLIHNSSGVPIGVLRVEYSANVLQQIISQNNDILGSGSFAMLLDENHFILANGNAPQTILQSIVPPDPTREPDYQQVALLRIRGLNQQQPNLTALDQGLNHSDTEPIFSAETHADGSDSNGDEQVAVTPLKTQPWRVAFSQPQAVFKFPLTLQSRYEFVVGMAFLVIVALLAPWFAMGLADPIVKLTDVANRVAAGDLSSYVGIETNDEIGQLATAFHAMVRAVESREVELRRQTKRTERLYHDLDAAYDFTLDALATALDVRDTETEGHSRRVVAYSLALAQRMNLSPDEFVTLRRGALLHDIGKIGVPDAILRKPGRLTDEEWTIMRHHPDWGELILSGISFLAGAAQLVRAHHERWDGNGYPNKLKGEAIPRCARIFSVADAFDAMTSDRPYRRALSFAQASAEIRAGSGTQFDPQVIDAFCQISEEEWVRVRAETNVKPKQSQPVSAPSESSASPKPAGELPTPPPLEFNSVNAA